MFSNNKNRGTGRDELLLPLMPLREVVMSPHAFLSFIVERDASIKAVEAALKSFERQICLLLQKDPNRESPIPENLYPVAVVSRVHQCVRDAEGVLRVTFEGLYRARWTPAAPDDRENPFGRRDWPMVRVTAIPSRVARVSESRALVESVMEIVNHYARFNRKFTPEMLSAIGQLKEAGQLADALLPLLKSNYQKRQEILQIEDPLERLKGVQVLLDDEMELVALDRKIHDRVRGQMDQNQREYYLSEKIRAINKELGREDDTRQESAELEERLRAKNMPAEALEKGLAEVRKLRQMVPASAEYTVVRTYIDWILDLPWNDMKETSIDIAEARRILDGDHFGLEKPKQRILEYLAVQKLTGGLKGPILCFVGPPGVGKTSLARSVARATGRDYVRMSLGGVRDEAEIRGHRRTYVGALPGKIVMAMKRAKHSNPLFCLDEIDKMSADYRGDPSSALLEVLDPEQNVAFADHYLDLDYDLSHVFFITTANSLQGIPVPLQDRMEIIEIPSYLDVEKKHIARDFLLPRQLEQHGLKPENLVLEDEALDDVIHSYTREAGVRGLEREIAALCRKTAIDLVEKKGAGAADAVMGGECGGKSAVRVIRVEDLESMLGVRKYRDDESEKKSLVGVVNGLAWTGVGGVLLTVETVIMPGKGNILATGKIGDVMNESVKAALSFVRSRSAMFGLKPDFHKEIDIHTHFPEGATPKDGPSAGIAITTSLVSALLGIPVRHDVAMTGEVTLRGRVLPIGGLREKLLAASRAKMKTVVVPRDNAKDLKEIPLEILDTLNVEFVDHIEEVLPLALDAEHDAIFSGSDTREILLRSLRSGGLSALSSAGPAQ